MNTDLNKLPGATLFFCNKGHGICSKKLTLAVLSQKFFKILIVFRWHVKNVEMFIQFKRKRESIDVDWREAAFVAATARANRSRRTRKYYLCILFINSTIWYVLDVHSNNLSYKLCRIRLTTSLDNRVEHILKLISTCNTRSHWHWSIVQTDAQCQESCDLYWSLATKVISEAFSDGR